MMQMKAKTRRTPVNKVKTLVTSLFDTKMKRRRKLMVLGIILYIVSPIDFIPDFIPMAGYADDILIPLLLIVAEKLVSSEDNPEHAN